MKNAIVDSDSSDDEAEDFGINQLTKSIQRVKLDDSEDEGFEDDQDEMDDDDNLSLQDTTSAAKFSPKASHLSSVVPTQFRPPKQSVGTVSSLTGDSSSDEETESEDDDADSTRNVVYG